MNLLTFDDAAAALAVNVRTIRRWIAQGRIKAYRIGPRQIRVTREAIDALCVEIPAGGEPR